MEPLGIQDADGWCENPLSHPALEPPGIQDVAATPNVAGDLPCIHCGYNLRTLAWAGACPECEHAVIDSRHAALSRFVSLAGVRWTQRGVALIAAAVLLPTLARIVFVLLTLYMLPAYWDAIGDRTSIPHQVHLWSVRALGYTGLASTVLWTAAVVAIVLPRFPRARLRWTAATRVVAAAAVLGCIGWLYEAANFMRQLPTLGPIRQNVFVSIMSAILISTAVCVGWLVLGLRLPRGNRRTRWLIGLALLVVVADLAGSLISAVDLLIGAPWASPAGMVFVWDEPSGWRRVLNVAGQFWTVTAAPFKQLVLMFALWASTRTLRAAAALTPTRP